MPSQLEGGSFKFLHIPNTQRARIASMASQFFYDDKLETQNSPSNKAPHTPPPTTTSRRINLTLSASATPEASEIFSPDVHDSFSTSPASSACSDCEDDIGDPFYNSSTSMQKHVITSTSVQSRENEKEIQGLGIKFYFSSKQVPNAQRSCSDFTRTVSNGLTSRWKGLVQTRTDEPAAMRAGNSQSSSFKSHIVAKHPYGEEAAISCIRKDQPKLSHALRAKNTQLLDLSGNNPALVFAPPELDQGDHVSPTKRLPDTPYASSVVFPVPNLAPTSATPEIFFRRPDHAAEGLSPTLGFGATFLRTTRRDSMSTRSWMSSDYDQQSTLDRQSHPVRKCRVDNATRDHHAEVRQRQELTLKKSEVPQRTKFVNCRDWSVVHKDARERKEAEARELKRQGFGMMI